MSGMKFPVGIHGYKPNSRVPLAGQASISIRACALDRRIVERQRIRLGRLLAVRRNDAALCDPI